jgi:hypothetical protein
MSEMRSEYFWALLTLVIAILLAIILLNVVKDDGAQSQVPEIQKSAYDERLNTLDQQALDDAYVLQASHLFAVWMKDDRDQPHRLLVGLRRARKAYIEATDGINARKQ